jgi:hypothetical protein
MRLNYESRAIDRRDPKSALTETLRGSKNGPQAKFGKETVAGHTGGQNGFHIRDYSAQADSGRA